MRIFVTGATGVIGRRAVPLLLKAGHQVTALARSKARAASLEQGGATLAQMSLFDAAALRRAVAGHDVVINLATHIPPGTRVFLRGAWRENDRIRREGSAIVADAAVAAGAGRLIQESFAPIYPDSGDAWVDESVPSKPARYNRTTLDAEASAARFGNGGGTHVVLRFCWFYGPDAEQVHAMLPMIRKGFAPIPGPPDAFWSSATHDDAATAVVAALGAPAGIYNIGDDEPLRHRELAGAIAAALGVRQPKLPPRWLTPLMGSVGKTLARSIRVSNRKFREASGWKPIWPSAREGWKAVIGAVGSGSGSA
jgi:nucleoside-diphosphate-sugar epimerase